MLNKAFKNVKMPQNIETPKDAAKAAVLSMIRKKPLKNIPVALNLFKKAEEPLPDKKWIKEKM